MHSIEGIAFGAAPSALSPFGSALKEKQNRRKEAEFAYENIIFRFDDTGFVEASFRTPSQLMINGEIVAFSDLLDYLKKKDSEYFEHVGFGICPRLGLAYDLEHEGSWTTAFKEGRWDGFRKKNGA